MPDILIWIIVGIAAGWLAGLERRPIELNRKPPRGIHFFCEQGESLGP